MAAFDGLLRDALVTTATIALPLLGVAALVGTAIAVVQAATQVQEQTLTLLPKIVAVGLTVAMFGDTAMHLLGALFDRAIAAIPALVAGW
ncbi:MAG TPA: flagellar biosynthetic protein FliQ [Candidatus Binatia bacterium]|nr:flagellar biosynthetic protein FliQ [Candidatus Binatia bacterium]